MIPPCDPSILEHNPQFRRLYENLTTTLLNTDGSTRSDAAEPARKAAVEDLKQCQLRSVKRRIKERTLRHLAFASDSVLSDECRDNITLISIYLETPCTLIDPNTPQDAPSQSQTKIQDDTLSLLAPSISTFYTNIPTFIVHFSSHLSNTLSALRALSATSDANTDTAPKHHAAQPRADHQSRARARDRRVRTSMAPVPPLASQLRARVDALRATQLSSLPAARREMAAVAAEVMSVRATIIERMVVILERAKHGVLARATRARAEHLATVAQGIEGKVEVAKLEIAATLYTPETLAALSRYREHLRDTRVRLDEQKALAIEELEQYGDAEVSGTAVVGTDRVSDKDGGTLAEIARQYGRLVRDVEAVRMEIARLGE
ncbi:uncharacterized protein N7482_007827 [Penicillium canariense]|uniref:Uncharacterized protein n=1 Tax=Penicillium canariense TaxID=189055 RepID=A0A9W9HXM5_9EURO|nr:uncharacterized protein N7482_007827 [Penicillium canariense]KAJ5160823.1 hypothetical protein N7482_007827 [Penicillium canariense]